MPVYWVNEALPAEKGRTVVTIRIKSGPVADWLVENFDEFFWQLGTAAMVFGGAAIVILTYSLR